MPQPTNPSPIDNSFFDKHKEKIYIGMICYLFGSNQETQSQLKRALERADKSDQTLVKRLNDEVVAANRIAFRQMVNSDTTYIFGFDSVYRLPVLLPDSTKR